MKEQILKLCKRLDRFNLDKIIIISGLEETEIQPILDEFVSQGKLLFNSGEYSFIRKVTNLQKYSIFQFYTLELIDTAIRCFCTSIPSYKAALILGIGEEQAAKFYTIFREVIYNEQLKRLNFHYELKPQQARNRIFFETEAYFYVYDNDVYVSENLLQSKNNVGFTSAEVKEFKKIYCYLRRCAYHNQSKHHLGSKLAEFIWRRNKEFEQLYFELKKYLGK